VEPHLKVDILGDLVEQKVEDGVGFGFGYAKDTACKARVNINALPAGYRMDTNDGVDGFDGLTADVEASCARSICLRNRTMQSCKTFEVCLHARAEGGIKSITERNCELDIYRKTIFCSLPRAPQCVTTALGTSDHLQRSGARWLNLICHIAMPKLDLRKRTGIRASCSVIVND